MPMHAGDEPEFGAEPDPLEEALRRIESAWEQAVDGLVQRYQAVDHVVMEAIAHGMIPPGQEVDALLGELGIRVLKDPEGSQK